MKINSLSSAKSRRVQSPDQDDQAVLALPGKEVIRIVVFRGGIPYVNIHKTLKIVSLQRESAHPPPVF